MDFIGIKELFVNKKSLLAIFPFDLINYRHTISGPYEVYYNWYWDKGGNYANGPSSIKCRCQQKKVDCQPTDSYQVCKLK